MARSNIKSRPHHDVRVTTAMSNVKSRSQKDVAYLHPLTYVPAKYQLNAHITFFEIQPGKAFTRHLPAQPTARLP